MSLLDRYIPDPKLHQIDRVAVAAAPDRAYDAVRHLDAYRIGFVRALFTLRALPDIVAAKLAGRASPIEPHATIDDLAKPDSDFQLLEDGARGFVVGAIGTFWKPTIEFRRAEAATFAAFDEPGWGKVAWGLDVVPREGGGSWITFEVRVTTTDDASFAAFQRYWLLIGQFSHAIRRAVLGMLERELGVVMPDRPLAGDDLLRDPRYTRTHEARIEAPPPAVWPWLVQMGCGRAGWYALDALDNAGNDSADRVHPEWQQLAPGDLVLATPDGSAAFGVLAVDPPHALVLGSPSLRTSGPPAPGHEPAFRMTWSFVLEPIGDVATLLVTRVRAAYDPTLAFYARHGWELIVHEVMQRAQLHNLRRAIEHGKTRPYERSVDSSPAHP